jgi:hypothetical protein
MKNETKPSDVEENNIDCSDRINRRSFVKFIPALGAAGFVAANLRLTGEAQTPSVSPTPSPSPSPSPQKPSPLAEAYAEVARVRFGEHIESAQWEQIKKDLEGNVRSADRLRQSKLKNADEPDFIFIA